MNYKIGDSLFVDLYKEAIYNAGGNALALNPLQRVSRMGLVQAELGNTYKLVERTYNIDLVKDQYEYNIGTYEEEDIYVDILQIQSIFTPQLSVSTTRYTEPLELSKSSIEDIQKYNRDGGLPNKYAVTMQNGGMLLTINSNPDAYSVSEPWNRLVINYWQKLYTFNGSGENLNGTWYDFDISEDGYGGEFKLPEDWHYLIVQGAVARAVMMLDKGASLSIWNKAVQDKLARRNLKVNPHIKYQLGFSR